MTNIVKVQGRKEIIENGPFKKSLFFALKKIKTLNLLRRALKHNKREIAKELGVGSHIDRTKSQLNYSLTGASNALELMHHVNHVLCTHQQNVRKAIRRDAVLAIEVVFSVSANKTNIDLHQYFVDCFAWVAVEFEPASTLSADVHLDEANPHLHVIFLCVTELRLVASQVAGNKRKYRDRREDFYLKVAKKHGLDLPPPTLNRLDRSRLAQKVFEQLARTCDPITKSQHYPAICESIRRNPIPFASKLNLDIEAITHNKLGAKTTLALAVSQTTRRGNEVLPV